MYMGRASSLSAENTGNVMSVDLGVKTGIAVFSAQGMLLWYGSRNYGNKKSLRKDVPRLLHQYRPLRMLILEGGGALEEVWRREAEFRKIPVSSFHAGHWRELFFGSESLMHTERAKEKAVELALRVIHLIGVSRASVPIHHAAEAILSGLYFLYIEGRMNFPEELLSLFVYPRSK